MQKILIPVDLANAIGEYLSMRPYREVAQLLSGLQQAEVQKEKNEDQ